MMRKENPVLVYGDLSFSVVDDKKMVLAYSRTIGDEEMVMAFNRSDKEQSVLIPVKNESKFKEVLPGDGKSYETVDLGLNINLGPLSAIVLKKY